MRVLLDTDVVLDYLLEREPFAESAVALFELIAQEACDGYVAAVTPVNVFYLARKDRGMDKARQAVTELLTAMDVCPVDQSTLGTALALPFSDYEDAVQHACATAAGLDAIITRNLDDYKNATLPIFSPTDFLTHIKTRPS
jgi:predicted nucleic acid-binding protein